MRIESVNFSALIWQNFSSLPNGADGSTKPLSQSVLYSTFELPEASAIALFMQPHGHNRGIIGDPHGSSLTLSLS